MISEEYFNFGTKVLCKYKVSIFFQDEYLFIRDSLLLLFHNLLFPLLPTKDVQRDTKHKSNILQNNFPSNTKIKMTNVTNSKLIIPLLFPRLERKKEPNFFYILTTHNHINKFLYVIYKSDKLRKRNKSWIKWQFGIIKETTQIPSNLVSGDDNNAFFKSQTWLKLGEKSISPGNLSPAEAINYFWLYPVSSFLNFCYSMHDCSVTCIQMVIHNWINNFDRAKISAGLSQNALIIPEDGQEPE